MEGDGAVALLPDLGHHGGHAVVAVQLVGHGGGGQEGQGVPGEELELHIGGAAAGDGGDHGSLDGVLRQGVEEGQGVRRQLQVGEGGGHVREGFVHDDDEVFRRLQVRGAVRQLLHPVGDGLGGLGGVVLRRGDEAVPQGGHEVQQKAVGLGLPLLGVDADVRQQRREEEHVEVQPDGGAGGGHGDFAQLLPPPAAEDPVSQGDEQPVGRQQPRRDPHVFVGGVVEVAGHVGGGAQAQQVAGKDDAAPEGQHIVVGKAEQKAEPGGDEGAQPLAPRQHPEHPEDQVVPDQVQRHLQIGEGREGVVVVQVLHHQVGNPRPQQKHGPGRVFPVLQPPGQVEAPFGRFRGFTGGGDSLLRQNRRGGLRGRRKFFRLHGLGSFQGRKKMFGKIKLHAQYCIPENWKMLLRMEFLRIISGCPAGAGKWRIVTLLCFCVAKYGRRLSACRMDITCAAGETAACRSGSTAPRPASP